MVIIDSDTTSSSSSHNVFVKMDTLKEIERLRLEVAEDELEFARDLHNESLSLPELTPEDRSHKLLMLHSTWEGVEMAERKVEEMKKEQARAHEEQVGANKEQASVKEEQQK